MALLSEIVESKRENLIIDADSGIKVIDFGF